MSNVPGYGPVQHGLGQPQGPLDQSSQQSYEPYPPPCADEVRLTSILLRIEARLARIETALATSEPRP